MLNELKRHAEALVSCDKAIALRPDYAEAFNIRGNALSGLRRDDEALAHYDKAIALKPAFVEAYSNRGNALSGLGRYDEALANYDKAIALRPDYAWAYSKRANALNGLGRHDEALANYGKAIALKPDFAEAYSNRAAVLNEMNRHAEALADYDKAIALKPDNAHAYRNQSLCLLLLGQFERGWRQYEWRKKCGVAARSFPQPLWLGEQDIAGKTLFLWWEQGYGDTLQFCRYAKFAQARGAKVIMSVQEPLLGLLKQSHPTIQFIADEVPAEFDYHCPLLSLPAAFGNDARDHTGQHPVPKKRPGKIAFLAAQAWRKKQIARGPRMVGRISTRSAKTLAGQSPQKHCFGQTGFAAKSGYGILQSAKRSARRIRTGRIDAQQLARSRYCGFHQPAQRFLRHRGTHR